MPKIESPASKAKVKGVDTLTISQQSNEPVSVIPPIDPAPVKHISQGLMKKAEGSERTIEPNMNESKYSVNLSEDTRA